MQEARGKESLCGTRFCAVTNRSENVQKYLAFPIRCKSWDCPTCRKIKAQQYHKRAERLKTLSNLHLYTFTFFHSLPPDECWADYNASWNRFKTTISRRYGKFNYVRVLESHKKSPYPHIHVIADINIPPHVMGPLAVKSGFGYQMDSKPIDSEGALLYILKYLQKEWTNEEGRALRKKYRCRIITFSTGLMSPLMRGESWNLLLAGTDLETCIDHIRTDYSWCTRELPEIQKEIIRDDLFCVNIVWREIPPRFYELDDTYYHPDDWSPK
jgi:hypothetical protein